MGAKLCSSNVNEPERGVKAPTDVGFGGGVGQGQPQFKVPLLTPQVSLRAPHANHSLMTAPVGAETCPPALPFGVLLNGNDFGFP